MDEGPIQTFVTLVLAGIFGVLLLFMRSFLSSDEEAAATSACGRREQDDWFEAVEWEEPVPDRPPESLYRSPVWSVLVDTASEARYSDHDLRYAMAVLLNEGIPAVFAPWEPGGHFGFAGPQYPTRLMVDSAHADASAAVLLDLFEEGYDGRWQVRVVDPLLDVYGRREAYAAYARMAQLAQAGDRFWRAADVGLLLMMFVSAIPG